MENSYNSFPADLTEGPNNLTITVTYAGNSAISAETTTSLTVTYDGILPSITSFTDQGVDIPSFLPITDVQNFTFAITFSELSLILASPFYPKVLLLLQLLSMMIIQ